MIQRGMLLVTLLVLASQVAAPQLLAAEPAALGSDRDALTNIPQAERPWTAANRPGSGHRDVHTRPASVSAGEVPRGAQISVSPNGRYLRKDGAPTIIVGCTGWLVKNLSNADMTRWLEAEAARGCDVANAGLPVQDLPGGAWPDFTSADPICADEDFSADCDTTTRNPRMRERFFAGWFDHLVSETARLGMAVSIPLMWGATIDRVLCDNGFTEADPDCTSTTRAVNYVSWVVNRYSAYPHIIWLVAGEYSKIVWDVDPTTRLSLRKLEELDANQIGLLNAMAEAVEANKHPDSLVSIHPDGLLHSSVPSSGSSRGHFSTQSWLDFSSLQAANNNINQINTTRDYGLTPVLPVLLSESAYESSDPLDPDDSPWHTRMAAWTHVLSGGAGFIYGHLEIWDFNPGWEAYLPGGATPAAGADDIYSVFKDFWTEHHAETHVPARELCVAEPAKADCGHSGVMQNSWLSVLRSENRGKLIAYAPKGNSFVINTRALKGRLRSRWFNPRTGEYTLIADPQVKSRRLSFDPPKVPAVDNDWVLVID